MLLACDVGGTKTLLGLFEPAERRPIPHAIHSYPTGTFSSFTDILDTFARDVRQPFTVDAAVAGVAGPVIDQHARLTHIAWDISAAEITARFGRAPVRLLNDLEAMANSLDALNENELLILQPGIAKPDGNAALIAAGTGLGQAYLHRVNGCLQPVPSEGGHADFAARTDREIELVRMLRKTRGRAEVDQVLSGPGLLNLHRLTHRGHPCVAVSNLDAPEAPAAVSKAGLDGACYSCIEALDLFVRAYGAEAGNLALRAVATAGLYVGGGIATKILPALQDGRFIQTFGAKPPMTELLSRIPVKVILNAEAGLLGAAVAANELART